MATLTAHDLRSRLVLQPRGYQFRAADNLYDLNWIVVVARLVSARHPGRVIHTRLATWELAGIAEHCQQLADGQRTEWQPRFFDSGVHLWLRRSTERANLCSVTALLSSVSGPLPVDIASYWRGERLEHPDGVEGLRFPCSMAALALLAEELRTTMRAFPSRRVRQTG